MEKKECFYCFIKIKESDWIMSDKNFAVIKAAEKMNQRRRSSRHLFYGDELPDVECRSIAQFPCITNLMELFAILEQCRSKETAYHSCRTEWVSDAPSCGQCAITAALVYDMFGGTIHKIKVSGGGTHHFNKLNGKYVDLTKKQFDLYNIPVNYEPIQETAREYCGKNKNTLERYRQPQRNMIKYLNG